VHDRGLELLTGGRLAWPEAVDLLTHVVKERILYLMRNAISAKGQITIPAAIRERLGLVPGTVVRFELRGEVAVLRKGPAKSHPVDAVYGTLRLPAPVDELLDEMRGPRPRRR
jgi:AbrB family looped-hinge helix DNA binding protein